MGANLSTSQPTLTNGAYTTQTSDLPTLLTVTAGASPATITLMSASTAGDGATQTITKADTGAGIVQVQDASSNQLAWLPSQFDIVRVRSNGTAWSVVQYQIASWRQTINATQNVTVPPLLRSVDLRLFGGGSGGGAGARLATSVARQGSGHLGGSGGPCFYGRLDAQDISATGTQILVTIGAGGLGTAPITTDNTYGPSVANATSSNFGNFADTGWGTSVTMTGGGGNSATAAANSTTTVAGSNGGAPGLIAGFTPAQSGAGLGGTATTPPTNGSSSPVRPIAGGAGGGGGAYISGQAGQNGGNGGFPGGGGGAGSCSDNGFNTGGGGNGAGGQAIINWNFHS